MMLLVDCYYTIADQVSQALCSCKNKIQNTKYFQSNSPCFVVVPFVAIPLFVLLVWWFVDSKRKKISHDELVAMLDKPESDDNVENLPDKESSKDET